MEKGEKNDATNDRWEKNLNHVKWIDRYPVDTLQIYFPCSLELQEELINKGFKVPADKDKKVKTPIPLIYSNFRGWLRKPEPITTERLIPPEWYGKTPKDLGWEKTIYNGKEAYYLPPEEVYVKIGLDSDGLMYFLLDIKSYHLEKISIRGVNPEKWNNWAMFYINAKYIDKIIDLLEDFFGSSLTPQKLSPILEKHQGKKEKTYYASPIKGRSLGVPVVYYSFCLGCFDLSLAYLKNKAIENGLQEDIVDKLKLRIVYDPEINTGVKIGVAKIEGKEPQIMFKLASNTMINIKGVLKSTIKGKARGSLCFCDHKSKTQLVIIKAEIVYSALLTTKSKLSKALRPNFFAFLF